MLLLSELYSCCSVGIFLFCFVLFLWIELDLVLPSQWDLGNFLGVGGSVCDFFFPPASFFFGAFAVCRE